MQELPFQCGSVRPKAGRSDEDPGPTPCSQTVIRQWDPKSASCGQGDGGIAGRVVRSKGRSDSSPVHQNNTVLNGLVLTDLSDDIRPEGARRVATTDAQGHVPLRHRAEETCVKLLGFGIVREIGPRRASAPAAAVQDASI